MLIQFAPCRETHRAAPYLLGRLSSEAALLFEDHYFLCAQCISALEAYEKILPRWSVPELT